VRQSCQRRNGHALALTVMGDRWAMRDVAGRAHSRDRLAERLGGRALRKAAAQSAHRGIDFAYIERNRKALAWEIPRAAN
jgi:hypothetical protein